MSPPLPAAPHKQLYQFIAVNAVLPVAIYYIARELTTEAIALALSAVPPGVEALVQMVGFQTVDPLSVFQIVSILLAIAFMCITNDTKLLFLKDSLTTALCGVTLIASTRWKQNIVLRYYMMGVQEANDDTTETASPHVNQVCAHICRVWGGLFICEALVRVVFIYICSTSVMVIVSPCMALICSAGGILWARPHLAALSSKESSHDKEEPPGLTYSPPSVKLA